MLPVQTQNYSKCLRKAAGNARHANASRLSDVEGDFRCPLPDRLLKLQGLTDVVYIKCSFSDGVWLSVGLLNMSATDT